MNYNFDKVQDRSKNKTRKWDKDLIAENFKMSGDVIAMDIADMDFECAPKIVNALVERAKTPDYGYSFVYDEYYDSIINWNKKYYSLDLNKQWIKFCYGTVSTLHHMVACFCNPGSSVLINTPVYAPFDSAISAASCKAVYNPLQINNNLRGFNKRTCNCKNEKNTQIEEKDIRYYIDFDLLEKQIVDNNVKMYILCSPHNPGGRIWTHDELNKISQICIKHNVLLVCDEVHREIMFSDSHFCELWHSNNEISNNSLLCLSPNKPFNLGGIKSSYLIIKNSDIRKKAHAYLNKVCITSPYVFAVPALIAAYQSRDWLLQLNKYVEDNINYVCSSLQKAKPELKIMPPDCSYLLWVYLGNFFDSEQEMQNYFTSKKITVNYGSGFVQDGQGWARFNLGTSRQIIKKALSRFS